MFIDVVKKLAVFYKTSLNSTRLHGVASRNTVSSFAVNTQRSRTRFTSYYEIKACRPFSKKCAGSYK
jgi:hypothetical protein